MTGPDPKLPARVAAAIARQQYRSEIWVGVAELCVAVLIALLYAAVPLGHSPDAPVRAVPLGLSLFLILVLLRLYVALTRRLGPWLIGFFTVSEMLTLAGTLVLYPVQFEASPAIGLKNTAFLYVFVLIALRALRFDPVWVLVSGATAFVATLGLFVHVLAVMGPGVLTWDYVTAATMNRIHPGAEFEKLFAILLVTAILALVLDRARRVLAEASAERQAAADLARFFDRAVAQRITRAENVLQAGEGEQRMAAILFTDLRGFTAASASLPPQGLIALLGEYQRLIVPIVEAHGGSIDKFLGDGVLASFGAVSPSGTYAADGFAAMDAILAAAAAWQAVRAEAGLAAPGVGAALAVGEVVSGVIGSGDRLEYTVIGETVNLAAKLEKHNKAEGSRALSTREAYELALAQGYAPRETVAFRRGRQVAGVGSPLDLVLWR